MRVQKLLLMALLLLCPALWGLEAVPSYGALPAGVQSFAPTGRVPEGVSFRLVFKNPMVPKARVGKDVKLADFPFTVAPAIQAEGKWLNQRTFTARLLAPLKPATSYTATLKALKDLRKAKVGPGNFPFHTDALEASTEPKGLEAVMEDGGARLTLNFNLPVSPARLKGFLRVLNEKGKELPYTLRGSLPSRRISLSVPLQNPMARQTLTVKIAAGLTAGDGDLGLVKDYSASVTLQPELRLTRLEGDEGVIRLFFNADVDPDAARDFIAIEPAEKFSLESGWGGNSLFLRGEFQPRNRFVVTLRRGLPGKRGGLALKEEYKQALIMPDLESQVSLPAGGSYLSTVGDGRLPVELVNVKRLQVDLWRLYENNIPYALRDDDGVQKDLARRVYSRELNLSLPLNQRVRRSLSLKDMAGEERGLFLLSLQDLDQESWAEQRQVVALSDLGAVARVWEDGLLLWVNGLTGAEPVAGARVRVYDGANQLLTEGETDSDGVFLHQRDEAWSPEGQPQIAVISKGGDLTYLQLAHNLLSRETFDTTGRPWIRDGYDAMLFSPRDIYRTGEKVPFKVMLRNADLSSPEPFPVLLSIRDPLGRRVHQEMGTLNSEGGALFTLQLPANALTGFWQAELTLPGTREKGQDRALASMGFHVEDFAPPRIEVEMRTENKALTHEDIFKASLHARWLFGVEGAGLKYKTSWRARALDFTPTQDRWRGYAFGDPSRSFAPADGDIGEGTLDASGNATTSLTLDADWEAASAISVTLRAEVMEDGGRWVSNSITRPYFPAPWLLGIAATDAKMAVHQDLTFRVAAIDPEENPADPGELTAELYRVQWNYNIVEVDGHRRWQSSEELLKVEEKTLTLEDGLGSVSFRPEDWGTYLVRVSDGEDQARAVCRFFASDPSYADGGSQLLDRVEVTLDKEFYKPGETARVRLRVPFQGLLLVSVEAGKLLSRQTIRAQGAEVTLDVPVTEAMRPNAWLAAWLLRPIREEDAGAWAGHRAVGLARIRTDLSEQRIDLTLDAADRAEPSTSLPVTLTLKDAQGKPLQGDVALALVDDAVLNLTGYAVPDPLNHFWGLKELGSQGYDLYDQLIPMESRATEPLHPAGGLAMASLAGATNAQRFKILSLFQGTLTPDNQGIIKTSLDLPEFSGRGRIFAVAASGARFGSVEATVQIARSVVTEAGLPRFAAPGDRFVAPFTVFNTANEAREVSLSISAEGLSPEETEKTLTLAPGEKASWSTRVKALDEGVAKWTVTTSWTEDGTKKDFRQATELPIRSPWPVTTLSGSGSFEAGETGISLPVDRFSGQPHGTLTLGDTPAVDLAKAAAVLLDYPYGCLEQTISTAWPFLVLPDAVAAADPLLADSAAVKAKRDSALARLQSMQLYDGSFEVWPGEGKPYNWGSVYAAHFLLDARDAGVDVPEDMLNGVMNWLRQFMASMPDYQYPTEERDDFTARAYGAYVLARYGEKPLGWIEYLGENRDRLWPSGSIWLAGAQALLEGRGDALRGLNLGGADIPPEARWHTLESEARNTAQLLSLWLEVDPQAPEVLDLALRLVKLGQSGWYSTQENAAALMTLARYSLIVGSGKASLSGSLTQGDKELLTYRSGKGTSLSLDGLSGDLSLKVKGEGSGYYAWSLTGTPRAQPKAERQGLDIECLWFDEKGSPLDLTKPIPQGTRMDVVLTLKPTLFVSNLAVACLLPSGLELENPRLDGGEGTAGVVSDIRDDRLLLFFDRLDRETAYGFKVRAVTKGTFALPPISALGMYDPSVRFIGGPQRDLVIK